MSQVMKFRLFALTIAVGVLSYVLVSGARAATPPPCPPAPTGATGCKCAAAACATPDTGKQCDETDKACTQNNQCWGNTAAGTYFYAVRATPETCVLVGPVQGKGCNNGNQTDCTVRRSCECDFLSNKCKGNLLAPQSAITPGGTYQPCVAVP